MKSSDESDDVFSALRQGSSKVPPLRTVERRAEAALWPLGVSILLPQERRRPLPSRLRGKSVLFGKDLFRNRRNFIVAQGASAALDTNIFPTLKKHPF